MIYIKYMKKLITILFVIITLLGYSQPSFNNDLLEKLIVIKINEYRENNTFNQLIMVDSISDLARKHSLNMSIKGYLYHEKIGYWHGENCGFIELGNGYQSYEEMAIKIVSNWINSSPHNDAILRDGDKIGVGSAITNNGRIYITYRLYITDKYFKNEGILVFDKNY